VSTYAEVALLLEKGDKARTTASTQMNETSSRSHAVFTLLITCVKPAMGGNKRKNSAGGGEQPETMEQKSKLCLIDLAGSERADRSGASGSRLREAGAINKSLSTLSEVIKALSQSGKSGDDKTDFIPYRNSVLTWLLKDCLGGNSKTVILAAISPAHNSYAETLSTLRYVERAKLISVNAVVNDGNNSPLVLALREEVDELLEQLEGEQRSTKYEVQTRLKQAQEHGALREEQQQRYDTLVQQSSGVTGTIRDLEEALGASAAELKTVKQQLAEKDEQLQKLMLLQGAQMNELKQQQQQAALQLQAAADSGKMEQALAAQQAAHEVAIAEAVQRSKAEFESAMKVVEEETTRVAAQAVEDAVIESRIADSKQARADAGRSKMRAVQSALKAKEAEHAEAIQALEAKLRAEYETKVEVKVGETALATAQAHAHMSAQVTAQAEEVAQAEAAVELEAKAKVQETDDVVKAEVSADRERADEATAETASLRGEVERLKKQLEQQQQQTAAALAGGEGGLENDPDMELPDCLLVPLLRNIEAKHKFALQQAVKQRQSEHEEALSALAQVSLACIEYYWCLLPLCSSYVAVLCRCESARRSWRSRRCPWRRLEVPHWRPWRPGRGDRHHQKQVVVTTAMGRRT
jgi:hypothetical protein